jgi:hypothetical protein
MPDSTYLPRRESELKSFASNLCEYLSADPARFGVSVAQAADLQALCDLFIAKAALLEDPAQRTTPNTSEKNIAKKNLIDGPGGIRQLVGIIQSFPGTTDADRVSLQLTVHRDEHTPVTPPKFAPKFIILSYAGQSIGYKLGCESTVTDGDGGRRARGVIGAMIYTFVGAEAPPLDTGKWQSQGVVTRSRGTLTFSSALVPPGSKVWITAAWINTRGQQGPLSNPIGTYLPGGLAQAA